MRAESKTSVKNSVGRMIFVGLSVLFQTGWIVFQVLKLNEYSTLISLLSSIAALAAVLLIYGNSKNTAYKMSWIMLILAFPVMGLCLYLLLGHSTVMRVMKKRILRLSDKYVGKLHQDLEVLKRIRKINPYVANQCSYIWNYGKYPADMLLHHLPDFWTFPYLCPPEPERP